MGKIRATFFIFAVICYSIEAATVDDLQRAINLVGNDVRADATLRIQQAEMEGLVMADTLEKKTCVLREGAPALREINVLLRQLQNQLRAEVRTMPQEEITPLTKDDVEELARDGLQGPIDDLVKERLKAINKCV